MLSLTRIYLHNWHRFHDHLIDVTDSLYLAGHNGSGKSSVLDALQLVLIGDLTRIRFNSSAQERFSARSLDTYVRGKIGESRFLRPGGAVAYVALEFTDSKKQDSLTLGACVESGEGRTSERLYFSLPGALDPALFVVEGRPLPRRELRQALRGRRGAKTFDQVGEYQTDLLNRLGGLNERFFDLFIKALRFEPIRNIRDFVEQWVLPSRPLELETLQRVVERLKSLSASVERLKGQLAHLQRVVEQQTEVRRLRGLYEQWTLVKALLESASAQRALHDIQQEITRVREQIRADESERAQVLAALNGAEDALRAAERELYQSDVVRHRDELQKRIGALTREADGVRRRWDDLRRALRVEQEALQPLVNDAGLSAAEQAALHALLAVLSTLQAGTPPPADLPAQIEAAAALLRETAERTRETRFEVVRQIRELKARGDTLEAEMARLKRDGRIAYRPEVERLRDLLAPVVSERPPLLCELLMVPDERWQDAVEAMLGPRRFNIIVRPDAFDDAVKVLDRARAYERLYDVGLLDLARALKEARPAQPSSLAAQVVTTHAALRAYIDQVLGDIITCANVSELRQYRRAITPEVVVYGEWTVRAVQPERYRPWFVGVRAQRSQIENLERQRDQVAGDLQGLVPTEAALGARLQRLEHWPALNSTLPRFEQSLDERPIRAESEAAQHELDALDLSGIAALEAEAKRLRQIVATERSHEREVISRLASGDARSTLLKAQQQTRERLCVERESDAANLRKQYPAVVAEADKIRDQRLAQPEFDEAKLDEAIANAASAMKNMQTRGDNARGALIADAARYNTEYTFAARADDPGEEKYAQEAARLEATELPSYTEHIGQAQKEAEDELREHVLHKLREQVRNARIELDRLNEALAGRDFRGKRYKFRVEPNDSLREFYDLINGTEMLGAHSLFESQFYRDNKAAFDRLYDALVRAPQGDVERDEQAKLTDYRRYLIYDIELTTADGQMSRLSRTMDQMSGGEVQTPFYLAIAASFVQLYRINERTTRPTIRLVAFDEAFSKMDQDHIGSTLDLFQHFNLQVLTATPLERCEYLVPKMCTSLVLTAVGDSVHIEPYVNYQARLAELYDE